MSAGTGREVDLPGGLIEALSEWKARTPRSKSNHPVFVSRSGRRQMVTNVDHGLKTAIRHANEQLVKDGIEPISERVTPHALRRTYASLRAALRDDPVYIAEQLGPRTRRSPSACTKRPPSVVSGSPAATSMRSTRRSIGQNRHGG